MKIAYVDQDHAVGTDFRGNPKDGQILLAGADGTRDNYRLSFTRQTGPFYSPRHAHNFDQIRMVLGGGPMNYGPDCWIQPGEIAYFPEGTPYGPQDYDTARYGVTFQFGGASGSGYISLERMLEGMEELKAFGTFEKGVFHRTGDVPQGSRRERDSYEAVWEHVNARPMEYPKPRYDEPILMKPDHFTWQDDPDQVAVSMKRLGTFSERQLEMAMLRVGAGARARIAPRRGTHIGVVLAGSGTIGEHELRLHAAFSLERDEAAVVTAKSELELLLVGLPVFAEHERYEQQQLVILSGGSRSEP
jgi:hypothetical protein